MSAADQPDQQTTVIDGRTFSVASAAPLLWFGALLFIPFLPTLSLLVQDWINNEDMGHGFFVPAVAGYIAWLKRDDLRFPAPTNYWGLTLVVWSFLQLGAATLGAELYLARTAFIFAIAGAVLFLCGASNFRKLLLPLTLLFFMVPMPAIIYNNITFPLQLFASRVAEVTLSLIGIPVLREGNVLELPSQRLSVVEACSGIRSLLSLTFLAIVYGFFFDSRPWMKWVLFAVTIPIAVAANALRVTITGVLSEIDKDLASGVFHSMEGWIIFLLALAMLLAAHKLLCLALGRTRLAHPSV